MSQVRRKLIEVALPLDVINRESAREKSIRYGHPATLHLWWARRPLAACRAVLFAQLVDDPSAHPEKFPTEEAQKQERQRLFDLIERLVVWENTGDAGLLREAYEEIAACFDGKPPGILDPFAGGGSIPLEAQRLGLAAHASDLNPVPVLINKALIELPCKWSGQPPVFPGAAESRMGSWPAATGMAEDIRRYGAALCDEARKRLGQHYPDGRLPDGSSAPPIAWIWARTVTCPNPACQRQAPLVRSFWLSKKPDRPIHLRLSAGGLGFDVVEGPLAPGRDGTVDRQGAVCVGCATAIPMSHLRDEGQAGRLQRQLLAVAIAANRRRYYVAPTSADLEAADVATPESAPELQLATHPQYMGTPRYGLTDLQDLFTARQLLLLVTVTDLVAEVANQIAEDAVESGFDGEAYAADLTAYLALAACRLVDRHSAVSSWDASPSKEQVRGVFARQAIAMTWDYAESNPFSTSSGNLAESFEWVARVVERLPAAPMGHVGQKNASTRDYSGLVVCTDPPYYDNVPYADLSDFFYGWLRRCLRPSLPALFGTVVTPKTEELVADSRRFGGAEAARDHFESGFFSTFARIRDGHREDVPLTVFYAFKQADSGAAGTASTGWETLLTGLVDAGLAVTATWPMRSELANRMRSVGANALASSIVLACRLRPSTAEAINRRGFVAALQLELPGALRAMQQGSVAPVDLAQAAIGPGMAVFTRYRLVVEADGSAMSVRTALSLINQVLDEVLSEQEGDLNADSRFAVAWFTQHGWNEGDSGLADQLARAKNTSVDGLERGGIFRARAGKAQLLSIEDLDPSWDPEKDVRISEWEVVVRVAKALAEGGIDRAAPLLAACGRRIDLDNAKELAYLLFALCEKKGWTQTAIMFNALGSAWTDLLSAGRGRPSVMQSAMNFDEDDEE